MDGLHFLISLPLLMCIGQILLTTAYFPVNRYTDSYGIAPHYIVINLVSAERITMGQGYRVIGVILLQNFGILWSTLVLGAFCTYILAGFCLYPYASSTNIYRKPTWVNRTIRRRSLKVWNRQLHFLIPLTLFRTQSIVFIQNSLQKTPHNSRTNGYYGVFYPLFNDSLLLKN